MLRRLNPEDQAPRHSVRYGMGMVLGLVAAFALLFAVIRAAGGQWPTVVLGFLAVFVSVVFFSVLGVILDVAERHWSGKRARSFDQSTTATTGPYRRSRRP